MENHHWTGIIIILILLAITLTGGLKMVPVATYPNGGGQVLQNGQNHVGNFITQPQENTNLSPYKNMVSISSISRSSNPSQEYITLRSNVSSGTSIDITGWTLRSTSTGNSVTIPKGTPLIFANTLNSEEDIILTSGDTVYLLTGSSPNGMSFKTNKCSGYLTQFQTFVPSISNSCPRASDEDTSSIPKIISNDACFDYIDSLSSCKIPTDLPVSWTYECKNFLTTKMNYSSCVNEHKNDNDFYRSEWRVYLRRSASVWKDRREDIILYDAQGKMVSEYKY